MALQGVSYITEAGRDAIAEALNSGQDLEIASYGLSSQDIEISAETKKTDLTNFLSENITVGSKSAVDGKVYVELRKTSDELAEDIRIISIYLSDGSLFIVIKPTYFIPKTRGLDFGLGIGVGDNNTELSVINVIDGVKANLFGDCEVLFDVKYPQVDCNATNKKYVDEMYYLAIGHKNLWVNGNFQVWSYGTSGVVAGNRFETDRFGLRALEASDGSGTGGTATWVKVEEEDRNAIKISHTNATDFGYFFTRFDKNMMILLKGKKVTLSFEYKFNQNMQGDVGIRSDTNSDGTLDEIAGADTHIDYIGDGTWHKQEVTMQILNNFNMGDFMQIVAKYYDASGSIPNGDYYFSRIQFEVNDKATDIDIIPQDLEETRCGYYYRKIPIIFSTPYSVRFMFVKDFEKMRINPQLHYTLPSGVTLFQDYSTSDGIKLMVEGDGTAYHLDDIICDAEIHD